jgi:signal transduction histidine kinase
MRGDKSGLIHIEYGFAPSGTLDYLQVWSSINRGYWLLACSYWMSASQLHDPGIHFENEFQSQGLADILAVVMQHQSAFDLPPNLGRKGLLQITKRLTEETLRTVWNIAMGLRPSTLDDSGIVPAVRWQASELSRRTCIPVELQIEGDFDHLGDEGRTCLYRVVQEALTNCARHAQAMTIQITMQGNKESVCLSIRDDGLGFDTARARGLGLIGIEERVKELGGSLAVRSWPHRGTLLRVEIPLASSNG